MSSDDLVTIEHKSFPNGSIRLSNIWLRDHCRCIKCYSETFQRRGNILDIPLDIHPINCQLNDDDVLTVDCEFCERFILILVYIQFMIFDNAFTLKYLITK